MALEMQSSVQRTRTRDGASRINFSLSAGALTLVGLAIVLVLGWCFYMGFMIGRGQNPEEHLQKIAAIWQGNNAAATAGQGVQAAGTVPVQAPGEVQTPGQLPAAAQMPGQTPAQHGRPNKESRKRPKGHLRLKSSHQLRGQRTGKQPADRPPHPISGGTGAAAPGR